MDAATNRSNGRKQQNAGSRAALHGLVSGLSNLVDAWAEHQYQCSFLPVVGLKDCIQYFKEEAGKLQGAKAAGFVLSVRKNPDPRNENDNYIVVQGLVDSQNKPVVVNGESVSRITHTRTIDDALIKALNGKKSGIFRV